MKLTRLFGRLFRKPVPVRASWEQTPGTIREMTGFLNWFDDSKSVEDTLERAAADWSFRFASHPEYRKVEKNRALEIGFGGGRLVLQACKEFARVTGVDIHNGFEQSARFLRAQGCSNFELLHRDQLAGVPSGSIDLVYSFIVFQHFDSMDEVRYYLDHIGRVLKPAGYAHIYFGRNESAGVSVVPDHEFKLRDRSLLVEPRLMVEEIAKSFEVLESQDNLPKDPVTREGRSGQFFVKFKRRHP